MADGVDIDLYADDLEQDFNQADEFIGDGVDLYDDVITAPAGDSSRGNDSSSGTPSQERADGDTNGGYHHNNNLAPSHIGRRHQLYVGNLTWWTTDQDISDAAQEIGVSDFQEVKFFENRSNGQSKGFCVVSLGSESSMRLVMDRLPKKALHGQNPVVTLPTKQALNQFESQQKTRPLPPTTNGPHIGGPHSGGGGGGGSGGPQHGGGQGGGLRGPPPNMMGGPPQQHSGPPPGHQPRMMNPNGPPMHMRGPHPNMPPQHMQQGPGGPPPRMQGPPMHQGGPMQQQGPPRFPNQQWNGPPRPNGPPRLQGPPQRPQMFQGPPGGPPPRGPRPDWNRPPMHGQGFPQGHPQGPPHMGIRGPPPPQMVGPQHGPPQGPAPHVNPAFFQGVPPQHPGNMVGPPGPHNPQQNMSPHAPPPRGPWPIPVKAAVAPFPDQGIPPQLNEVEFEEIMTRNRTVSSSAIARAVSDAAAGEYASAIETLVTAISLIKQSKVAHDERCKILISSLQDTLHGIESKSYSRRERSRSRDRSHRRPRRDRSSSRYRERSRDRERERDRDRERERDGGNSRYYNDNNYRESGRTGASGASGGGGSNNTTAETRERSRTRERDRTTTTEHYRDESSTRSRPRKSPEVAAEPAPDATKRNYYDDRYRSSDRDRDRDRDRRDEHRSRH